MAKNGPNQAEVRKRETWILKYAAGTPDELEERTIHCSNLGMKNQSLNHAAAPPCYIGNLRVLINKCQDSAERGNADPLSVEALSSESKSATQAYSEAPTLHVRVVYCEVEKIGQCALG